jgi:glycosyltransferase involved in cell wall biosynthesis
MTAGSTASTPWLSVVIPSYCGEQWISTSLSSIAAEGAEGIEILVIDGSPTTATLDIARTFSRRLDLRVFERRDLASWHTKTNFGVEVAKASHICWLGVDDVWLPGRAGAARAWIGAAPEASLHLAPSVIIDRRGRKLGLWRCPLSAGGGLPSALVIERLLVQNFVAAPAPVFRKDSWLTCGGLDEKLWYTADWDMWLKLAACGQVHYHDDVTIGFRIHGGSLTVTGSRDAAEFSRQMHVVLDRHISRLYEPSKRVERAARASIVVNTALAAASGGQFNALFRAGSEILRLGPAGMCRYFRDSRIVERVAPRLRAKWGGEL